SGGKTERGREGSSGEALELELRLAEPRLHVHLAVELVGGGEVPFRRRLIRALRQGASERAMTVRRHRTHPEPLGLGERLSDMLQCPSRVRSIRRERHLCEEK